MLRRLAPLFFLFCFVFCFFRVSAQTVAILHESDFHPSAESRDIEFIEPSSDSAGFQLVASLKATGKASTGVETLFLALRNKALELKANAFRLVSFREGDSAQSAALLLDVYYGDDSAQTANARHHEKNAVYVFGAPKGSDKILNFKVDNAKKEIHGGTWLRYPVSEGKELKINKGGFTGATLWVRWKEDKSATFLTLSGLAPAQTPYTPGQVTVGFTTGRIDYMTRGLGYLLVKLWKADE